MLRAMVLKELRETRGIALLALLAYAWILAILASPLNSSWHRSGAIPFVSDGFIEQFALISAAMAIALGLRQTLGESVRNTYSFLLHRPANRYWLIGVKLLVGLGVYLICAAIPIVACGLLAARPGTHASPFEWSMTVPAWEMWFRMTLLYLGAFLTGIRPGQWYRSRLLPLAAAAIVFIMVGKLVFEGQQLFDSGDSLWPCLAVLGFNVWLIAAILFVARTRDYS